MTVRELAPPPKARSASNALRLAMPVIAALFVAAQYIPAHTSDSQAPTPTAEEIAAFQQAAAYSKAHSGLSMLIMKDGAVIFEDYTKPNTSDQPNKIYSGGKSFSCAIAVAAAQDGLLEVIPAREPLFPFRA